MGHFLAIGIHHVFSCTYLEWAPTAALESKSFAMNNDRKGSLRSAHTHPMVA
jgi:hypothetical protein